MVKPTSSMELLYIRQLRRLARWICVDNSHLMFSDFKLLLSGKRFWLPRRRQMVPTPSVVTRPKTQLHSSLKISFFFLFFLTYPPCPPHRFLVNVSFHVLNLLWQSSVLILSSSWITLVHSRPFLSKIIEYTHLKTALTDLLPVHPPTLSSSAVRRLDQSPCQPPSPSWLNHCLSTNLLQMNRSYVDMIQQNPLLLHFRIIPERDPVEENNLPLICLPCPATSSWFCCCCSVPPNYYSPFQLTF